MTNRTEVLGALSGVRDPDLDEPITNLDFVSRLEIEDDADSVRLRLPTYFCAPNFAYLMVADARAAILSIPGVRRASVVLDDHYASEEINGGVNEERGFDGAFPGETEGPDLEELRAIFSRKSFVARQEALCRMLLSDGYSAAELAGMQLGEVPSSEATEKYLERRTELGLDTSPGGAASGGPRREKSARRGGRRAPAVRPNSTGEHRGKRRAV
jgi:metal-sulfur cluster biosynthetic enzyme